MFAAEIGRLVDVRIPIINAEIQQDEIVYKNYYNIGVAVGTEKGLVVPVVRDADELSFADIEKQIVALGEKAKTGQLSIEELQGGTFTITNGGIYGSMLSTPILNPPQSGVLGMHNIVQRAVVVEEKIEVRPIMYLALSYDHRIIDGKDVAVELLVVNPVPSLNCHKPKVLGEVVETDVGGTKLEECNTSVVMYKSSINPLNLLPPSGQFPRYKLGEPE